MRLRRAIAFTCLAILTTVGSCSSDATDVDVQTIVDKIQLILGLNTITVGQTVQAGAIAQNASGGALNGVSLSWSSSNPSVASVTQQGAVTGVAPGSATITATGSGKSASATVTVIQVPVASVTVSLSNSSVVIGTPVTATATTRDASTAIITGRSVSWTSSNPAVATINPSTGAIATLAAGSTTITATSEGVSGTAVLTVTQVAVTSVTVSLGATSLLANASTTATVTARDAGGNVVTGRPITWNSSNISVATVSNSGQVTAVTAGTASISATIDGVTGSATLTVQAAAASVSVTLGKSPLTVNGTTTATAVVRDVNGNVLTGRTVSWSSSNPGIASVTQSGEVTASAVGTTSIIATVENVTGSAPLTVVVPVGSVSVAIGAPTIRVGLTTNAVATVRDINGNVLPNRPAIWTSADPSIASVGGDGTVLGVKVGSTAVIATVDGVVGSAAVTVVAASGGGGGVTATQLAISQQPSGAQSGLPFLTPAILELRDANGVPVVGLNSTVVASIASGSGSILSGASAVAVNGVANFSALRIAGLGPHSLTFTTAGLSPVTSSSFTITQAIASLDVQTQPAGAVTATPFTVQPVVRIVDPGGVTVAGSTLPITVAIAAGNGTLSGTTTVNAVNGVATFTNLQITGTGTFTLRFSTPSPALQVLSAALPVSPGPPSQIVITTQPTAGVSGLSVTPAPVIELRDLSNTLVAANNPVTVALASGSGALVGTTTVNPVNGVATFNNIQINGSGPHTLIFTSAGLTSATSSAFTVTQNAASLSIQTQPAGAVSGAQFGTQPIIRVLDNAGLLVANSSLAVTATRSSGTGTLGGTLTVNAVNGVATFTNLQITGTGAHALTFTAPGVSGVVSSSFTVAPPGGATQLAITTQPAGAVSGVNLTTQPVIEVRDQNGALVSTSSAAVTAAISSGSGTLVGTTTVNAINGVATFTNLKINGVGAHNLTFTATGLTPATSSALTVTQTPASLAILTQPSGATTGSALTQQPVVRILDNAGLLIANSTLAVTATRTTGTATLSGTTTVNAVNGVASFANLRLDGTGTNGLTFSTTSPALQIASSTFTVAIGPPAQLAVVTQPNGASSGFTLGTQPVIRTQDVAGSNTTVSGTPITAAVASGTATLSGTTTVNTVNGVATFTNLVLTGSGNVTLVFSSGSLTPVTSASITIVAPGTLDGTITDGANAAVGGGTVEIVSNGTVIRSGTVAGNGTYSIGGIAPGSYLARLQAPVTHSLGTSEPSAGQSVTITSGNTTTQNFKVQAAMFFDDFQSYTTAQLVGGDGFSTGNIPAGNFFSGAGHDISAATKAKITMDPTGGNSTGPKAARYDWAAFPWDGVSPLGNASSGYCGTANTTALTPRFVNPPTITNLWVRFTAKESPNFEHGSASCMSVAGLAYKYFLIEFDNGSSNARFGTYLINSTGAQSLPTFFSTDFTDRTNTRQGGGFSLGGANTSWGGAYHTFVLEMLGIGTANAQFNIYMDGVLMPGSLSGPFLPGNAPGAGWAMGIAMGANINNGPDHAQSRWFRELGVYTTRPSTLPLPP